MKAAFSLIIFLGVLSCIGCVDPYAPNSYGSPYGGYNDPYSGSSRYDDDYYRRQQRDEWRDRERREARQDRREVERERERLREEQRRLEEERARHEAERRQPPPRMEERCPSGFSPSERKCSQEERRRGCRDMRLPGGLGCVSR